MSTAARYSSRPAAKFLALALAAGLLSGCTTTSALTIAEPEKKTAEIAFEDLAKVPVPVPSPRRAEEASVDKKAVTASVPARAETKSAWCDYTAADAGAEASILRSPTLSASASDGGSKSVNVGMNLLDFAKAAEIERAAKLRCEQKVTEGSLKAIVALAAQSHSALGAPAKAEHLAKSMPKLDVISSTAKDLLAVGDITAAEASAIEARIAQVRRALSDAKIDASKVEAMSGGKELTVAHAASRLRASEKDLQASSARMRSLNAMSVNVETGWSSKDKDILTTSPENGHFYGKVSVGVRLGAIGPTRRRFEEEAMNARLAALDEPYTGIIWQSDRAAESAEASAKQLLASREAVSSALKGTRSTLSALRGTDRIELASTLLASEIDAIILAAELAAIDASLAAQKENGALTTAVSQ